MLDRTIGALIQVRNSLSSDSVAAAIALLAEARRIEFYGAGGSGIAALDVQHKFFRLGVPSVAYSDPHTFHDVGGAARRGRCGRRDLEYRAARAIFSMRASRRSTAARKVIAITHGNSPLARMATRGAVRERR